jgi:hypothetical protein
MPLIRSTTFKCCALLVLSIILLSEIITSCSYCAEKKLLYIVTDLEILVVLVTRLLRRDLNKLVNGIKPVEPQNKG